MRLLTFMLGLCCLMAGCTVQRPDPVVCNAPVEGAFSFAPTIVSQALTQEIMVETMIPTLRQVAEEAPRLGPVTVHVLSLSSGGQFGAFGAGFLRGWSENPQTPRPAFDLVTGVSAGALLAPVAFAGSDFDPALDIYRGLAEAEVYRRYPTNVALFKPSISSTEPLNQLLRGQLTDAMIDRIGDRFANEGAQLLVSAANLDTTENRVFNLGATAARSASFAAKRDCIIEPMLASAAVPGLFPPRNIDGALYADGGLRDHVFFRAVESARAEVARDTGRDLRVEATIIVNGALRPPAGGADDTIIGYFTRSAEILADEVLRDSISESVAFAQNRPNWRIKGIFTEVDLIAAGCAASDASGTIDPCVTRTLFDEGRALARRAPIPWKSGDALLEKAQEL